MESEYTDVQVEIIEDGRLYGSAKRLLCWMIDAGPGITFERRDLAKSLKVSRCTIFESVKLLKELGYVRPIVGSVAKYIRLSGECFS